MKKFLFALSFAFAAFAASAQTQNSCLPGQGCNDPNAQQVNATVPTNGVQAPAPQSLRTTQKVDVVVDKHITIRDGVTTVTNMTRSTCINMNGTSCGVTSAVQTPVHTQPVAQVQSVAAGKKCDTYVSRTITHVTLKNGQQQLIANHNQYRASCGCSAI